MRFPLFSGLLPQVTELGAGMKGGLMCTEYLMYVTKGKFNIHILTIQYKNGLDKSFSC
jgi:hypothetical protein